MSYMRTDGLGAYMRQDYVTPQVLRAPWQSAAIRIPPAWSLSAASGGLGFYDDTGNYSWEFYPPPYDFLAPGPGDPAPGMVAPEEANLTNGLGGCGCGGSCCSSSKGVGQIDLSNILPTFYTPFASSDISTWGWEEWGIILAGGYLVISMIGDAAKGVGAVRSYSRKRTSARRKALQAQMDSF